MIAIDFNPETQVAKLAFTLAITAGVDVPVKITFAPAPGDVSSIQLGLMSDAAAPATLAYTETFAKVNANQWSAVLDANDSRLLAALAGKTTLQVMIALICTIDGDRTANTTLRVTVQPPVLTGPEASEGGPSYYTVPQTDAAIAAAVAASAVNSGGALTFSAAGTVTLTMAGLAYLHNFLFKLTPGAGSGAYVEKIVLPLSSRANLDTCRIRVPMPASANPTLTFHTTNDATAALFTIAPDAAVARFYNLEFLFNGAAWELWSEMQNV